MPDAGQKLRRFAISAIVGVAAWLSTNVDAAADPCTSLAEMDVFAHGGIAINSATCSTYVTEAGTKGASCHWGFKYRDNAARVFADELLKALSTCRPGTAGDPDKSVNHPDSYDLVEWQSAAVTYALSVKDKGNLGKTYVFLRRSE